MKSRVLFCFLEASLEGPIIKEFGTKVKEEVTLDQDLTTPWAPQLLLVVSFIAVYQIFLHCMSQICLVIIDSHQGFFETIPIRVVNTSQKNTQIRILLAFFTI